MKPKKHYFSFICKHILFESLSWCFADAYQEARHFFYTKCKFDFSHPIEFVGEIGGNKDSFIRDFEEDLQTLRLNGVNI